MYQWGLRLSMKKLLILLLLSTSFSAFSDSHIDLDFTLSDFCYKQPDVQKRAGVYYFPNNEVGISAKSTCVYKDEYGQFYSQGRLKNGVRNGKWIFWYKNGVMHQEQFWVNGVKQGLFTHWHENGEEKAKQVWKDDTLKEVSGWDESGEINLISSEDSKSGNLKITFYKSGIIVSIGIFKSTYEKTFIKHGKRTNYFSESGLKFNEGNFKDDKKDGIWIEWNKTGQNIIKTSTYKDGKCISGDCPD